MQKRNRKVDFYHKRRKNLHSEFIEIYITYAPNIGNKPLRERVFRILKKYKYGICVSEVIYLLKNTDDFEKFVTELESAIKVIERQKNINQIVNNEN